MTEYDPIRGLVDALNLKGGSGGGTGVAKVRLGRIGYAHRIHWI